MKVMCCVLKVNWLSPLPRFRQEGIVRQVDVLGSLSRCTMKIWVVDIKAPQCHKLSGLGPGRVIALSRSVEADSVAAVNKSVLWLFYFCGGGQRCRPFVTSFFFICFSSHGLPYGTDRARVLFSLKVLMGPRTSLTFLCSLFAGFSLLVFCTAILDSFPYYHTDRIKNLWRELFITLKEDNGYYSQESPGLK